VGELPHAAGDGFDAGRFSSRARTSPAPFNVAQLKTLAALHDAGKLTDEELSTARQRLLA
jgi:hypothetical protein